MRRRPIDPVFEGAVLNGIKTTTIRNTAWSGKPYRSKQRNIAPIIVESVHQIDIEHAPWGIVYTSTGDSDFIKNLWKTEGFPSQQAMDLWFASVVKKGSTIKQFIHKFRLATPTPNLTTA